MSLLDGEGIDVQEWYDDHRTFVSVKKEQERIKLDLKKEAKAAKSSPTRTIEKPKRRYGLPANSPASSRCSGTRPWRELRRWTRWEVEALLGELYGDAEED